MTKNTHVVVTVVSRKKNSELNLKFIPRLAGARVAPSRNVQEILEINGMFDGKLTEMVKEILIFHFFGPKSNRNTNPTVSKTRVLNSVRFFLL